MGKKVIQKKRINCISCGATLEEDIVIIGDQYPSAIFIPDKNLGARELTASSLNLTRCTNERCRLVQLANEYDLQYVFDHYPYESGSTATMKQILQDVVDDAQKVISLNCDDVVLDIGGNDGTLLGLIRQPLRARVNIDAAAGIVQSVSSPDYLHVHARFDADVYRNLNLPNPRLIFSKSQNTICPLNRSLPDNQFFISKLNIITFIQINPPPTTSYPPRATHYPPPTTSY